MSRGSQQIYEFGPFRLDAAEHLLTRDDQPIALTPKVFTTLLLLVENGGHLVGKDELLAALWPDVVVEESNLNRNISALRKSLGDTSQQPQYIETIPKRGYRFIAPVRKSGDGKPDGAQTLPPPSDIPLAVAADIQPPFTEAETTNRAAASEGLPPAPASKMWRGMLLAFVVALVLASALFYVWSTRKETASQPPAPIKSIAVLPFKNANTESDEEYLGVGLTDALARKLSTLRQVSVRPTSEVLKQLKAGGNAVEVGRRLQVDAVLEGVVQKSGDRIRVTAQLLSARDGSLLWGQTFDEQWTDIFSVQDAVSLRVIEALALPLTDRERQQLAVRYTQNTEAYRLYLQAIYLLGKRKTESLEKSIKFLERAIELDPNFAPAYYQLTAAYVEPLPFITPKEAQQKQKQLLLKALEVNDTFAATYSALAFLMWRGELNWAEAERLYKRAIELEPNVPSLHANYGVFLASQGRVNEGIEELTFAQAVNPTSLGTSNVLGTLYIYARRYDDSIKQNQKIIEIEPDYASAYNGIGWAYGHQGKFAQAFESLEKAARLEELTNSNVQAFLGYFHAVEGNRAEALKALEKLTELEQKGRGSWGARAVIHTGLQEKEQAFSYLEKALADHEWWVFTLKANPVFDSLRSDPRFDDLLRRTGLTP